MNSDRDQLKFKSIFKLLVRIYGFVRPFAGLLVAVFILNTIFSALTAVSIALIKPIIEILFNENNSAAAVPAAVTVGFFENLKNGFYSGVENIIVSSHSLSMTLINLSILIVAVFLLKNFFKYWSALANGRLEEGIVKLIRDTVFAKLAYLSVDFFTKRKEGSLISIITNDVSVINHTTIMSLTNTFRELIQIVLFFVLLLTISPYLTFIAFSTSIISLLLLRFALKFLRRYAKRMQNAMADYTTALQESISGIRVVKAYNAEENAITRFKNQTLKYLRSSIKHRIIIALVPSVNEIFAIVALCVVLYVGGVQVLVTGQMQASDLMAFLFYLFSIMSPVATTFNNVTRFQQGFVAAERVFDIIDQKPSVETGTETIENFLDAIEIKNINFSYIDDVVIKNADFKFEKTKKIAFVGASGSGKSTMLDLIIRFYDPNEGQILIDGRDIKMLKLESYRSLFGIVAQDTMLFNDTISDNIRYGYNNASMEDIIEAAKISNAYNFIMKLPKGFDTVVGDRGITLSGGERQRLAIARALLRNPQILVFDEATSALDAESEKVVQDAINSSLKDRTAILVAHRLATIIDCDEIFVFDRGEIVERGSHSELIARNGIYRKLYDIQFAG